MHLKWSDDYLVYLILIIPLILVGWWALRASDKEKARDKELAAAYPEYAKWKRLRDRWTTFGSVSLVTILVADSLASDFPTLKPVFQWVIPFVLFTWAPAEICAMVLWAGRNHDWRSYLSYLWRPMVVAMAIALAYWRTQELMQGLPLGVKLAQLAVGVALSPLFLRMSGFFELDKFQLESAPKSGIPRPMGRES